MMPGSRQRYMLLLALQASAAHGWFTAPPLRIPISRPAVPIQLQPDEFPASRSGAATGAKDIEKTNGIPTYMLRTSGTVARLSEGPDAVQDDGVVYEQDHVVTILTSDVIDMVQQEGGDKIDHLGENILVDGMLFDDFKAEDTFEVVLPDSADSADEGAEIVVTLEIVEPRPSSALELGQLGDDADKKRSITSLLSISPGFAGWTARVVVSGRVRSGCKISKRDSS